MNLSKLFEMQRELDERIVKKHGLEGQDLLRNTMLALQVELGKLANEWKGFKHWSRRQSPSVELEECDYCGEDVDYTRPSPFMADTASMCRSCWNSTKEEYKNSHGEFIPEFEDYPNFKKKIPTKVLEEYVDCLHFFLSYAIQKGWEESMYLYEDAIWEVEEKGLDDGVGGAILEIKYFLSKSHMEKHPKDKKIADMNMDEFFFRSAWFVFICTGLVGFKFTLDQIEQAYMEKNMVNHERQDQGY
jgi:dimeric dUTPase (all-alpha-NTP-PPase superfamily)